ncbi:MAG: hypothetical protein LUG93_14795 [Lachnospiraceae bacterium]|nr:hypothetical protein [Lachnospiraceae bacterium]
MLNQLIYTRCFPHRDLKNQGQVNRSSGFGIFSLSQELFADGEAPNPDLLQRVLAVRSGSREASDAGTFSVYEYTHLSGNTYALSREETRTRLEGESSGQRSGGFIKQCYTGEFAGRPCEWFGTEEWDAYKRPESDYYLDQDAGEDPEWLPQTEDEPFGGYIDIAGVKSFVRDGRTEAVKAALWFLLYEFDKPEEERRVLLIRDTPENVELWISAIEYALPEAMAGTVTFVTNRTNLTAQINSELFYYVDDNGRFSPVGNSGGTLKRRPYCMITGFHPQDEFCGSLALASTDRYVLIDGAGKAACFQPTESIDTPYYTDAVQYGKKIKEFYTNVLPCLKIPQIGTLLERAYNAWDYLLSENRAAGGQTYYTFCSAVDALREAGLSAGREATSAALSAGREATSAALSAGSEASSAVLSAGKEASSAAWELTGELLEECIHLYPRFMEEDEDGGYALLALMWKMAQELECSDRVSACLADRLSRECENLASDGARLGKTWDALKHSSLTDMVMPALAELFGDDRIIAYTPLLETISPATAAIVLDLFFTMTEANPRGFRLIGDSDEKYRFVCLALIALQKDRQELEKALARLQTSPEVFYAIVSSVSEYLEKTDARGKAKGEYSNRAGDWWEAVLALYGGNIGKLCETLYQLRDKLSGEVEDVFFGRLDALLKPWHSGEPRTGVRSVLSGSDQRPGTRSVLSGSDQRSGARSVLSGSDERPGARSVLSGSDQRPGTRSVLLSGSNQRSGVHSMLSGSNQALPEAYAEMKRWASASGRISASVSFYEFRDSLRRAGTAEEALSLADDFAGKCFTTDNLFVGSEYFKTIAAAAARFCNENLHFTMACLFSLPDARMLTTYIDAYVSEALSSAKGHRLPAQIVSLAGASFYMLSVPGRSTEFMQDAQHILEQALRKYLPHYYTPKLTGRVLSEEACTGELRQKLMALLEEAGQNYQPSVTERIAGKVFGRRKRGN